MGIPKRTQSAYRSPRVLFSERFGHSVRLRSPEPFLWLVESLDGDVLSAHQTDVQACVWWRLRDEQALPVASAA